MSGKALLDAVYAAPDDREARLVYGDWLLERGDPRGELIQLQLREPMTEAQAARAAELVEAHAEAWIGRLTKITTWVELELGFLARCGLAKIPAWAVGMREWATVKHVGISDDWNRDLGPLVTHAAMKSLESLRLPARALETLLAANGRSKIRRLTVDGRLLASTWPKLVRADVLAALAELEVRGGIEEAVPIWDSRYTRITFVHAGWELAWTRGPDDELSALAVRPVKQKWGAGAQIDLLLKHFEALPSDVIGAIDLGAVPGLPERRAKRALRKQVRVVDDL